MPDRYRQLPASDRLGLLNQLAQAAANARAAWDYHEEDCEEPIARQRIVHELLDRLGMKGVAQSSEECGCP
jgi:hypothetical protein